METHQIATIATIATETINTLCGRVLGSTLGKPAWDTAQTCMGHRADLHGTQRKLAWDTGQTCMGLIPSHGRLRSPAWAPHFDPIAPSTMRGSVDTDPL